MSTTSSSGKAVHRSAFVTGLAFAAVFAWIIRRLVAEEIRREFLER